MNTLAEIKRRTSAICPLSERAATVICTYKTGTLTENRLKVKRLWLVRSSTKRHTNGDLASVATFRVKSLCFRLRNEAGFARSLPRSSRRLPNSGERNSAGDLP